MMKGTKNKYISLTEAAECKKNIEKKKLLKTATEDLTTAIHIV